jgi:hypothetical protein
MVKPAPLDTVVLRHPATEKYLQQCIHCSSDFPRTQRGDKSWESKKGIIFEEYYCLYYWLVDDYFLMSCRTMAERTTTTTAQTSPAVLEVAEETTGWTHKAAITTTDQGKSDDFLPSWKRKCWM